LPKIVEQTCALSMQGSHDNGVADLRLFQNLYTDPRKADN